jgi:hypothetical protein
MEALDAPFAQTAGYLVQEDRHLKVGEPPKPGGKGLPSHPRWDMPLARHASNQPYGL